MTFEEVLQHFDHVEGQGKQRTARCPAHSDRRNSLSIGEGEDGRTLIECHAGCDIKDILSAAGLKMSDLFAEPLQKNKSKGKPWKFVDEYFYPDKNGQRRNKKVRYVDEYGNKKPVWYHYDNQYNKWVKDKDKNSEVGLYNQDCIKSSDTIFLVEGEKDVETLRKCNRTAVSVPNGAGSKWKDTYTEHLKGKNVIVIQDNDEPGKKLAIRECNALTGQAASVKLVDLCRKYPSLKEHGDITDLCELNGDSNAIIEAVEAMAAGLPEYQKQYSPEQVKAEKPDFFENGSFRHNLMGDFLIEKYSVCKINGALHIYDNGIYKRGEDILHGHMIELYPQIKDAQRREVYKYMKVSLKTPEKKVSPPNLIPFATKVYNVETDEFLEYSPEYVFLNRFPYDYKPNAPETHEIVDTIRSIADDNKDVENLMYEAIGNCFYLFNSFRGSVMLYGSGKNGKSTLLNIILQVVGEENASKLSLQNLSERFMLADVYGKAVNIGDDIPDVFIQDTSIFKKVATGEYIQAEHKGQDPFAFAPYAKMFFSMNALPPVGDKSAGFFSRVILIPLQRTFEQGKSADVKLKFRKWSQSEMEYLVKLAMDGLKRLLQNGDFTMPDIVKEALQEYELENNPIKEFLSEHKTKLPKPTEELYDEYRIWFYRTGHKNLPTRKKFAKSVCLETGWRNESIRHKYFGGNTGRCFIDDCHVKS